jgi:hypothetical protein
MNSGQFKPGESGNPKGSPRAWERCEFILQKILELGVDKEFEPKTKKEAILYNTLVKKAEEGDLRALETLLDRIEGKAKQLTETRDKTLEDNPIYQQLRNMTEKFREKE